MVTSSAVVGSSAISRSGFGASAIATATRCRSPPESWWGYWPSRRSGSGMPTSSSSSTARRARLGPRQARGVAEGLGDLAPIFSSGFSDVIESWKTIAMRRPRNCASPSIGSVDEVLARRARPSPR